MGNNTSNMSSPPVSFIQPAGCVIAPLGHRSFFCTIQPLLLFSAVCARFFLPIESLPIFAASSPASQDLTGVSSGARRQTFQVLLLPEFSQGRIMKSSCKCNEFFIKRNNYGMGWGRVCFSLNDIVL